MRKTRHVNGLNCDKGWVVLTLVAVSSIFFTHMASAQDIKPRLLILFDTSGSMARDIGEYDPDLGYNVANSTNGDGSWDVFNTSYQCCEGAGGSRMYIAKEAMREMILATGDIEFALMKFPQRYVEDLDTCSDYTDPVLFDIYGSQCAAKEYKYNQGNPKQFDELRYYLSQSDEIPLAASDCVFPTDFSLANSANWLCEEFSPDSSGEIVAWMDHSEFSGIGNDAIDSTDGFYGPHGDTWEQELRAEGVTPLAEAIGGAYGYFDQVITSSPEPVFEECRPYILVILSDGDPELPLGCIEEGWVPELDPVTQVENVWNYRAVRPILTYVIGLAHQSEKLNDMAVAGGTGKTEAYKADSKAELSSILVEIINASLLRERCNYIDDDCDGETDEGFATFCDPEGWVAEHCLGNSCSDTDFPEYQPCDADAGVAEHCLVTSEDGTLDHSAGDLNQRYCIRPPEMYCDGYDDNCDGVTDEDDADSNWTTNEFWRDDDNNLGDECGIDVGLCEPGNNYCVPGDDWTCLGARGPSPELCDGLDNDCDGDVDEGLDQDPPVSCFNPSYGNTWDTRCSGELECIGGGWTCVDLYAPPDMDREDPEVSCDGIDNDCDGETDEDITQPCGGCDPVLYGSAADDCVLAGVPADEGECRFGNQACDYASPGHYGSCEGSIGPVGEICDGKDNDCDGETDDIPPVPGCGPPCDDGEWQCNGGTMECVGYTDPVPEEVCDGLDNDCDGDIDEGLFGESCGLGPVGDGTLGICGIGNWMCVNETPGGPKVTECCTGVEADGTCIEPVGPGEELCNSLDDDCDGATDEEMTGEACDNAPPADPPLGVGICVPGLTECISGQWVCNGPLPQTELCDGIDNDCDGVTDNNPALGPEQNHSGAPYFLDPPYCNLNTSPDSTNPSEGLCLPGTYVCQDAAWWCVGGRGPTDETCNGEDDDCNALVDDGLADLGFCALGSVGDGTLGICEAGDLMCVSDGASAKIIQCCIDTSTGDTEGTCIAPQGPELESCNGRDDNCNGVVDEGQFRPCLDLPEGGTLDPALDGVGICHGGNQACAAELDSGVEDWGDCEGVQGPTEEECDCLDNDCDGVTDYLADGGVLTRDPCACGIEVCNNCNYVCNANIIPEVCNGLDDNCNNAIDENLTRRCGGCVAPVYPDGGIPTVYDDCLDAQDAGLIDGPDEGECQRGVSWCEYPDGGVEEPGEEWAECTGAIGPREELCDDRDNDCDGETDEDVPFAGESCDTACELAVLTCTWDGIGEPAPQGTKRVLCCAGMEPGTEICIPPQAPETEKCDGLDNDCDNLTDETENEDWADALGLPCGAGNCQPGTIVCGESPDCDVDGGTGTCLYCQGDAEDPVEACNCIDDDCDGLTDEDLGLGAPCLNIDGDAGVGECDWGNMVCDPTLCDWNCNANSPRDEVCDALDNDCDGETDEGVQVICPAGSVCIMGECSELCSGTELSCPSGMTCEYMETNLGDRFQVCISDICTEGSEQALECVTNPYWCTPGHTPAYEPPCVCDAAQGACVGLCEGVNCSGTTVCVPSDGTCQPIASDCFATGCPGDERCVDGTCADTCEGVVCSGDKYCNPNGDCVSPCVDMDCPAGCFEGACVSDPCAGVACSPGDTCNASSGECEKDEACAKVACKFYELCEDGTCTTNPCWDFTCPNGLRCLDGACYEYTGTEIPSTDADVDTDADTDTDTDADTDTDVDVDAGVPVDGLSNVLVTGAGGCLCSNAPGSQERGGNLSMMLIIFGLAMAAVRFGLRQRKRLLTTFFSMLALLFLLGCETEPYEFASSTDTDTDTDTDSDTDTDTDADTDTDSDTDTDADGDCDPDAADDDCDGVDEDCDGATDEDVDLNTNPKHCGECGNACQFDHAVAECENGVCALGKCQLYYKNLDGVDSNGCEYFCRPSDENAAIMAAEGIDDCTVDNPLCVDTCNGIDLDDGNYAGADDDCDGETDEDDTVNFATDPDNCGRCKNLCRYPNSVPTCVGDSCVLGACNENFYNTDDSLTTGCNYACPVVVGSAEHEPGGELTCDGLDNDCDGVADDEDGLTDEKGTEGGPCVSAGNPAGVGICAAGTWECQNGTLRCVGEQLPVAEVCDGVDNDCDGLVNENLYRDCETDPGSNYGTGICSPGIQRCDTAGDWGYENEQGIWTVDYCGFEQTAQAEDCNGADDDCDGIVDNNLTLGQCSLVTATNASGDLLPWDTGRCEPGELTCDNGEWVCQGDPAEIPIPETGGGCNGVDDDCDGETDELISFPCGGCDIGEHGTAAYDCADAGVAADEGECAFGTEICGDGGVCQGDIGPTAEMCDNRDNDCDGVTDEMGAGGIAYLPCGGNPIGDANEGECEQGTRQCELLGDPPVPGFGGCNGATNPVLEETIPCNGLDDDCDGVTDENLYRVCGDNPDPGGLHPGAAYDVGICVRGQQQCINEGPSAGADQWGTFDGSIWTVGGCLGEVTASNESCNSLDDDCDGTIDEGLSGLTCGACGDGTWQCHLGETKCCETDTYTFSPPFCNESLRVPELVDDCDALGDDDDCNPATVDGSGEEDFGSPCDGVIDSDLCAEGIYVCDGDDLVCSEDLPPTDGDATELCDGLDNDCDGETDEGATIATDPCGNAIPRWQACAGPQVNSCVDGQEVCTYACLGTGDPGTHYIECAFGQPVEIETICDELDNDCDGETDEGWLKDRVETCGDCNNNCTDLEGSGFVAEAAACIGRVCQITACVAGHWDVNGDSSDGCEYPPSGECFVSVEPETFYGCNYVDDDCDGLTDEGAGTVEVCNGVDDDCDTIIDPADGGVMAEPDPADICNTVGLCAGNAVVICNGAAGWECAYDCAAVDCNNGSTTGTDDALASTETACDGNDSNCNGLTDENFNTDPGNSLVRGLPCDNDGVGGCLETGIAKCNGSSGDILICCEDGIDGGVCADPVDDPGTLEGPEGDYADGEDNNCNGVTDEGTTCDDAPDGDFELVHLVGPESGEYDIFAYEASMFSGLPNSVPCSSQGAMPWAGVDLVDARSACQRMNAPTADCDTEDCWDVCSAEQLEYACAYAPSPAPGAKIYPYGDTYDGTRCNGLGYGVGAAIATGTAANIGGEECISDWGGPIDIWDLSGNVEEWTISPTDGDTSLFQIRGGSYNDQGGGLACAMDMMASPSDFKLDNLGFRCCRGDNPVIKPDPCGSGTCADLLPITWDFETTPGNCDDQGWLMSGDWEVDVTEWPSPWAGSCVLATDPNTVVNLPDDPDSDDLYGRYANYLATSPPLDLECCDAANDPSSVYLRFDLANSIEPHYTSCGYDWGHVQVFDGTTWQNVTPYAEYAGPSYGFGYTVNERWCGTDDDATLGTKYIVNVTEYMGPDFRVMFRFHSDDSVEQQGMYIDNVELFLDNDLIIEVDGGVGPEPDAGTDAGPDPDPVLACWNVVPRFVQTSDSSYELTIVGNAFEDGLSVTLDDPVAPHTVNPVDVYVVNWNQAVVVVDGADVAVGNTYTVTLDDGVSTVDCGINTVQASTATPLTVDSVTPNTGWEGGDFYVEIQTTGFGANVPYVTFVSLLDPAERYSASLVYPTGVSGTFKALCPALSSDMPAGDYDVYVASYLDRGASWSDALPPDPSYPLNLNHNPPPKIDALDPFRGPSGAGTTTITGENFDPGAEVHFYVPGTTPGPGDLASVTSESETELQVSFVTPSKGIYVVRVTNTTDDQYDEYYYWGATPASAVSLTDFLESVPILQMPRWRHDAVEGFDPFQGSYIYAVGGLAGTPARGGDCTVDEDCDNPLYPDCISLVCIDAAHPLNNAPIGNTEIIPVSIDGTVSDPFYAMQWNGSSHGELEPDPTAPTNLLNTPRHGHALVRSGNWLYVVGGAAVDTTMYKYDEIDVEALATVERARILGLDERPVIIDQSVDISGSSGPGVGVWYYQVAALGDWGESLPSEPVMIYNPVAEFEPRLAWNPVPGATGYNIYRGEADDGTTYLLEADWSDTTYEDDSGSPVVAVEPLPPGSIGKWQEVTSVMSKGREGVGSVAVSIAGEGGKSSYIYAVGGRVDNQLNAYLADGEFATILPNGDLSPFSEMPNDMQEPRAFFQLLTSFGQDVVIAPPSDPGGEGPLGQGAKIEDLVLIALVGDSIWDNKTGTSENGPDLDNVEVVGIIKENGITGDWTIQSGGSYSHAQHGSGGLLYFDNMWMFPGVQKEVPGLDPQAQNNGIYANPYFGPVDTPPEAIFAWPATGVGESNPVSMSYYAVLRLNGYLYLIGGNDEAGPMDEIYQTQW